LIENNLISGNAGFGIWLQGTSHVRIRGNLIGTDVTGMHALGNGSNSPGIVVTGGGTDVVIGGTDLGSRNVISGNAGFGSSWETLVTVSRSGAMAV
jgi:parallel beta-helix repeat protein